MPPDRSSSRQPPSTIAASYDWQPHIELPGLTRYIKTVTGLELTGSGIHMNAFPLNRGPFAQDGGAPVYNYDPRINALVLRNWGTASSFPGASRHDTYQNARVGAPYRTQHAWIVRHA